MCFSATASFIAGGSLIVLGTVCVRKIKNKSELPFALIPLLLGFQQISEGILWVSLQYDSTEIQQLMSYIFTGFSRVLWPIYVPLSILALEKVTWRLKFILVFFSLGLCSSLYLLYHLNHDGIYAEAIGHHIVYFSSHQNPFITLVFYVAATCISCFFSSHQFVRIFGGLCLVGFISAYFVSEMAAFSVWCFFAGLISFYILFHFNYRLRNMNNSLTISKFNEL